MRKLFVFNLVTVNGFFEGENHSIDWHNVDSEFNEFSIKQLQEIDTLIFGRTTYELMASFWPTETAMQDDPMVAKLMNEMEKYVVSTSLDHADWENTKVISENLEEQILELKNRDGKDIAIFGSSKLASSLLDLNLIDEIKVIINPIVLGKGTPLFEGAKIEKNLEITETKLFKSGNILLIYRVK